MAYAAINAGKTGGHYGETLTYARSPDLVTTELDGKVMLLSTRSWEQLEFEQTAFTIWSLLDQPATLPALVDALTQKYDVPREQCQVDTKAFLDEMVKQGILVVSTE